MRNLRTLVTFVVALSSTLGVSVGSAGAEPGAVNGAFARAAAEFEVPRDLLVALAYGETHLDEHRGKPSSDNGFGVMHLVSNPRRHTLERAATLSGESADRLRVDTTANIRGGAALLRALGDENGLTAGDRGRLGAWFTAVAGYGGASDDRVARMYADTVYELLNTGLAARVEDGEAVLVPGRVVVPDRGRYAKVRPIDEPAGDVTIQSPDYPPAHWVPADPGNYASGRSSAIDLVVIHVTQGSYSGTISWFQNPASGVSAHYVVRSSDGDVTQMVRDGDTAFHVRSANSRALALMRGSQQGPAVLAGPGGAGKTTVAAALADHVRARGGQVWWISAVDPVALLQGLTAVARQLGATSRDVEAIARESADAADRFWRLLDGATPRWLLVFDEVDDPGVLAAGNSLAGVQDRTGWVRSSVRGVALVTSRETDPRMWGAARLLTVGGLEENDAAQILRELAPAAGDDNQARALARRLDGHPLSLHLAGSYLRSQAAGLTTFAAYEEVLGWEAEPYLRERPALASTRTMARALDLSLDGLAQRGIPQARPVLQLASCYASTVIPAGLLDGDVLASLQGAYDAVPQIQQLDEALHGLREVGLIRDRPEGIVVHSVVTAAGRATLDGPERRSDWIRQAAVALLAADVDSLPYDRHEAWPDYVLLGPHLLNLLETTADRVDQGHLRLLVETTARMARAMYQSRASQAGRVLCERALAHSTALGNADLAVLRVRHYRAWAVADQGDLAGAEAQYRDVLHHRLQLLGPAHPEVLRGRHELAWIAACRDDWANAEQGYRAVLHDSVGVLDPDDPDILITRHELGWAIANQGRLDEAREVIRAVLADRMQVLGPEHQRTLATQHELAWITARQGEWAAAETDYRRLLDLRLQLLGEDHPDTLLTRHELAWIAARQGRTAEAAAGYADVLNHRRRVLGEDHPQTRASWEALEELRHGRIVDARHLA